MMYFFFQNLKMETLETIFSNPGLFIIAIDIFKKLDPNSLINARLVCKSWKTLIDTIPNLPGQIKKLKLLEFVNLESVNQLTEKCPYWNKILSHFLNHRSNQDILKLGSILQNYFNVKKGNNFDPLMLATTSKEWDNVEFILKSVKSVSYLLDFFFVADVNLPNTIYRTIDQTLNEDVYSIIDEAVNENVFKYRN